MSNTCDFSLPTYLQCHNLTDECKELLRSLASENGWLPTSHHLYQGFWYITRHLNGVLSAQHHFKAQDSDIFLLSQPKSGTTWLKAILLALLNRSRYSEPDRQLLLDHPLLQKNPHDLVLHLETRLYVEGTNPDLSSFTSPRLFATHIPFVSLPESVKESKCKLVYMCRNPKDTFVSLWHFTREMSPNDIGTNTLEEAFDMFCRGFSMFGPHWDHVLGYYKASLEMPHKVLFLKYEEMKDKPSEQLKRLADFLGCPFSREEEADGRVDEIIRLCSFNNLSKLEVNQTGKLLTGHENKSFFRKGEVGDWVNYLTPEMVERIDRITEEKFGDLGLKF
ncbi:cytosolic sulfotransferase 5-like [Punica granatum]|uniref:Sulfotransferase n=2 Tax=Punica granatum TaxID=22663 RepID=A0A218XWX4_PUNGR|nr:cytosolic sulfotransferase 5-like [Punica granatum]OWM89444.1 hypothetical protein CDL15_Pgr024192 [Punica granatum]PKI62478.1 hypothetical protein CRG98_017102 [Punica granatum]